eukprot:8004392-Lingulodinium_polyedra.AAC.1
MTAAPPRSALPTRNNACPVHLLSKSLTFALSFTTERAHTAQASLPEASFSNLSHVGPFALGP